MPKLAKNRYTNAKGERKLNCYLINIPKKVVEETDITEEEELIIYACDNKIVIDKKR